MKKEILIYKENKETLSQISEKINWDTDECRTLIQDLKDTLAETTGVGLSAIQIGVPKRVCYIRYNTKQLVMINPVIIWKRFDYKMFNEGCLSAPNKYKDVRRSTKVICEYTDENGEKKTINEGGWLSVIIQHEVDHLDGRCRVCEEEEEAQGEEIKYGRK